MRFPWLEADAHILLVRSEFDAKKSGLEALLLDAETDGATHTDRTPCSMLVVAILEKDLTMRCISGMLQYSYVLDVARLFLER